MKIGRCIREDAGFLGCQNDALPAVDSECSGRKHCEVFVSNKVFRRDVPGACMSALSGYARIAYTCADGKDILHELIKHMNSNSKSGNKESYLRAVFGSFAAEERALQRRQATPDVTLQSFGELVGE